LKKSSANKKTLLSWSSGKDSAWALHVLRQDPNVEVLGLFTSSNEKYGRVSMHATPLELLERQAESVGLPVHIIRLPDPCTNENYDTIMQQFLKDTIANGIQYMAFGDLFLEDIRKYREDQLEGTGISPLFPLWKTPTRELAEDMLKANMEAYISSIDLKKLPERFVGQKWSMDFVRDLPKDIDPCGENGEFHTVVVDGPMFQSPIPVRVGRHVRRDGFAYADIVPDF
jgi:uncharacterized protein (TIGR00290 family)